MRKATVAVMALLAGLMLGCPQQGGPIFDPTRATIVFHNESELPVEELFIGTQETWPGVGPNLVADNPIIPGESRAFGDLCPGSCTLEWDCVLDNYSDYSVWPIYLDGGETWHYWFY